ncbi:bifunctional phosphoribosylaminoimidazolecarboxamide formyltransferase/IMP cyclohydrolase [Lentibacillus halophilus]|uniref:Bifunctional purine biosynthesis protein PurH n=1 Tax=Lentibacillus halophilus TaxID=295065 RepID=A0ABP3IW58_9BACI
MKRVLISVYDKRYVESFASELAGLGYEIVSTGGTLKKLRDAGVDATAAEDLTGFAEMLDGRVKTLHPALHGGILADRGKDVHLRQLADNDIKPVDMVVVNLYPFKQTLDQPSATEETIIENIDIGGPAMLRAAAKNMNDVTAVVDPDDYEDVLDAIRNNALDRSKRKALAAKVFRHTAQYDALIAGYMTEEAFPENYTVTYEKVQSLRYGENPHQQAAFYKKPQQTAMSLTSASQLHGKQLSYNNIQDANAALAMIAEYDYPTVVAVKHMNPSGIGEAADLNDAFAKAYDSDPVSIFGGIVACNRTVDKDVAKKMGEIFLEIVMAPQFTEDAIAILTEKKNIRLLKVDMQQTETGSHELTAVHGGVLIQSGDDGSISDKQLDYPTEKQPTEAQMTDLAFAWKAVKHVKSNAIVLAKEKQTLGVGAGQMNRVGAAEIAVTQAGDKAKGSVLASDAFFPMPDTVEAAAKAGVTAIIQPGGSKRDQDSIDMCNQYGIAMVFTSMRHFKH